jgi:hypothetical protein
MARRVLVSAIGLAYALTAPPAGADEVLRTWRPSSDPAADMVLEPTVTPGAGRWSLGAWAEYTQFPAHLCCIHSGTVGQTTERLVGVDLVAGVGIGSRFAIGVDLPFEGGVNAISVTGKATVISNDHDGVPSGLGLAMLARVFANGGAEEEDASIRPLTTRLDVLGEFAVGIGALRAELGYQGPAREVAASGDDLPAAPFAGVSIEDIIPWAIGLDVRPKVFASALDNGDRQVWEIAAHGSLPGRGPITPFSRGASAVSPALLAFDDRLALGHYRELFVTAGVDLGLDQAAGVPVFRAVLAVGWSPRSHDKDGDGIDDDADQCPDLPEDRDGIQDADGCPEDDADGDAILDQDDACPLVPGVPSNDPKKNGCPGEPVAAPPPPVPVEEKPSEATPAPPVEKPAGTP